MKRIVNRKIYDTKFSKMLCTTQDHSGFTWDELYQTRAGVLFLAHITCVDGCSDSITPVSREEALDWCEERNIEDIPSELGEIEEPEPKMGRPRIGTEKRQQITMTLDPATIAAIEADRHPGESTGQVIDRWASERS